MTKLPPIEKVYEAWSAIADGRVSPIVDNTSTVTSSDSEKTYTVKYDPATDTYSSDDNATFWRGYAGYPVLAVMMLQGRLPLDPELAKKWAGVNWHELNEKYKRDYAYAVEQVEQDRELDPTASRIEAEKTMDTLKGLPAKVKRLYLKK